MSEHLTTALSDRYRVEREVGQGGMATVYLAHDLKHERKVAIKVLHPELAAVLGADRFLAEIRTTANLQHPHILPLFDSGAADGLLYYVMPFVEGETLRARLERETQLPVDDAVRIAREVADALAYAHAHGVIHRDIKPENVLLHGGHALVADFGIALAVQTAGGTRMTQTGLSLGTPQYMSPEQAMGERAIDARSDIYSLAAVLYEMLVGEPPFSGPTVQSIVAKVMTERPTALSAVRDTVPAGVERAVLKALAKLPADRFASAEKFGEALTLTDVTFATQPAAVVASSPTVRGVGARTVIAGAVIAALSIAGAWWLGRRSAAPVATWSAFSQLTDASGMETSPSLSPDGEYFAYASNARGSFDVYVQRVGGHTPVLVAGDSTVDEQWPAYSPDGKQIAYNVRGGGIFVVGATGESTRRLTTFGSNPAWSPDAQKIVFGSEEVASAYNVNGTGTLWTVDVSGGEPRRLGAADSITVYQPAWSPSGARIAFWSATDGQRDLETIGADGTGRLKVTNDRDVDWAPAWSADGKYLYFASDRGGTMGLWRIAVDESSGRATGIPESIASGVDVAMDLPHLSRDGATLLFRSKLESINPAAIAFDRANARIGDVTLLQHRTGSLGVSDMSPDGKWLALYSVFERQQDLFLMHPDGSGLARLTDDLARDWNPQFTPDGTALTYFSNSSGSYQAWSIRLDGSGRTRLSNFDRGIAYAAVAPDNKRLLVALVPKGAAVGTAPWPMTNASATPIKSLDVDGGSITPTTWSRDGRWIVGYVVDAVGEPVGFGVLEVATGRARRMNSDSRSYNVAWLPGSHEVVYFINGDKLVIQNIETLARREIAGTLRYPPDIIAGITISPDGRTLYYGARQVEGNIWVVRRASAKTVQSGAKR